MPAQFSGGDVNAVLRLVKSLNPDGDAQASILTKALVTACLSMGIDKAVALEVIEDEFDHPTDIVPLDSPEAALS